MNITRYVNDMRANSHTYAALKNNVKIQYGFYKLYREKEERWRKGKKLDKDGCERENGFSSQSVCQQADRTDRWKKERETSVKMDRMSSEVLSIFLKHQRDEEMERNIKTEAERN